jgi:hypothetical protein
MSLQISVNAHSDNLTGLISALRAVAQELDTITDLSRSQDIISEDPAAAWEAFSTLSVHSIDFHPSEKKK